MGLVVVDCLYLEGEGKLVSFEVRHGERESVLFLHKVGLLDTRGYVVVSDRHAVHLV